MYHLFVRFTFSVAVSRLFTFFLSTKFLPSFDVHPFYFTKPGQLHLRSTSVSPRHPTFLRIILFAEVCSPVPNLRRPKLIVYTDRSFFAASSRSFTFSSRAIRHVRNTDAPFFPDLPSSTSTRSILPLTDGRLGKALGLPLFNHLFF